MVASKFVQLNTGAQMPTLGFGESILAAWASVRS